jgi:hypothetical protein
MLESFKPLDGAFRMIVTAEILPYTNYLECLIDTGAPETFLPLWYAHKNGIELPAEPTKEFSLDGTMKGWLATVDLQLTDIMGEQAIGLVAVPVYFCDPWQRTVVTVVDGIREEQHEPRQFGVLGFGGCLNYLKLTVWGNLRLFQLEREGFDQPPQGVSPRVAAKLRLIHVSYPEGPVRLWGP